VKKRLQFDFSVEAVERLDNLVSVTDAASRAEVVRRAITLLGHVLTAQNNGSTVIVRRPDGREYQLMIF
jgi:Arc/MetJ-type ribon-helix-helix transcriptional regulator